MRTILVSGFEPIHGEPINPSWELAQALDGAVLGGVRVHAVRLPCTFSHEVRALLEAFQRHRPALVLSIGQAAGRAELSFERAAINLVDAPIADNTGAKPEEQAVLAGGPVGLWSTLALRLMVQAAREAGVHAGLSQTVGTFFCNQVFYLLQPASQGDAASTGFLHVALLPQRAARHSGKPTLPIEARPRGVGAALSTALVGGVAQPVAAGALN